MKHLKIVKQLNGNIVGYLDNSEVDCFYFTKDTQIAIELGTIKITTKGFERQYLLNEVSLFNNATEITIANIDQFVQALRNDIGFSDNCFVKTENDALAVGNEIKYIRDNFVTSSLNTNLWEVIRTSTNNGLVGRGGNTQGSSYLRLFVDPKLAGEEIELISKETMEYFLRFGFMFSQSQRVTGIEFQIALVGCDSNGVVEKITAPGPLTMPATVSITTNVATITFTNAHEITGDERLVLYGNADTRLNVGPVFATIVNDKTITVPCTLANGTYPANGFLRYSPADDFYSNSVGLTTENTTVTQARWFARRDGLSMRSGLQTISTTTAVQSNASHYSDAFNSASYHEIIAKTNDVILITRPADSMAANTGSYRYNQSCPQEKKLYKISIRAKNLENLTVPVAKIVSIAKTGTTTATVTTDVNHGLTTNSFVQIYGVRDITNFPNLTAQTQVASIISPTQFTIIIGGAVTATSAGGGVYLVNGSNLVTGVQNINIQSISRTNNILTVIGSGSWASILASEHYYIFGCDATTMGLYDGNYKVLRTSTTTLELESVGNGFTSINCGGAVVKIQENRVHSVQQMKYTRLVVESF